MEKIFSELTEMYKTIDPNSKDLIAKEILSCEGAVVGLGAGRMGYALQAFIMRLSHLGYKSYMIGDTSLPRIGSNDLVIVNSSSGETPSILLLAKIAQQAGARIILLTGNSDSSLAKISDLTITYENIRTEQLMKTVYEQFSFLFFDSCAAQLAELGTLTVSEIEINHSILE